MGTADKNTMERVGKVTAKLIEYVGTGALMYIALSSPAPMRKLTNRAYKYVWKKSSEVLSGYMKQRLSELHDAGYIDMQEGSVKLTRAGKQLLRRASLRNIEITEHPWDNKWRCVAYDIPDVQKKARESFRHILLNLGFVKVQESIFALPYRCEEEIAIVARILGIEKNVIFMEASDLPSSKKLKQYFNI